MYLHVEFRDIKKWKYSIQIFFFTQKIFNINQKNYESDKGIFRQFYFYFKRTVRMEIKEFWEWTIWYTSYLDVCRIICRFYERLKLFML